MRLIDADALDDVIQILNEKNWGITRGDYKLIDAVLFEFPTVEERKTGKWYKPNGVMPPEHFGRHRCSICDAFAMHDWKHHREQLTDYCPNCGARMEI